MYNFCRKAFSLLLCLLFICSFCALAGAYPPAQPDIKTASLATYENARFNYQMRFPEIFSRSVSDADDGGIEFASEDGRYKLYVKGVYNNGAATGHTILQEIKGNVANIIESSSSNSHYSISYTDHGGKDGQETVFAEYGIIDKNRVIKSTFIYPLEDRPFLKDKVTLSLQLWESYYTLVNGLGFSQILHYDPFSASSQPDESTINQALYYFVRHGCFSSDDNITRDKASVYFSDGPENSAAIKDSALYFSPDKLYKNFFANGRYKYPPASCPFAVGTQTGMSIILIETDYAEKIKIKKEENKGEHKIITIDLIRQNAGTEYKLGEATITLKKDIAAYFGYTIVAYKPHYNKFDDMKL